MTYDNYGNILTKNGKVYVYGDSVWKDKLTSFDGQAITYDAQGNPVTYLGHALTWEKGRQLKSFDTNSYTYNANGIRTSKIVNGIKHDYILDGAKILRETWGDNVLVPLYDNEDSVCGIIYNGSAYYFLKNLQGDVVTLVDSWGNLVARYTYDAWGKCTGVINNAGFDISNATMDYVANINPFRYRGYYLDRETGLYYLQSRYYDPCVGRFLNADEAVFLTSTSTQTSVNSFIYCENDCIDMIDYTGFYAIKRWMVSAPIDMLLCLIPGIGAAFAPIKSMAKTYGKTVLKSKIKTPLASFIKFVAKHAKKFIEGFKNIVKKIPWFGKSLAKKIPVDKLTNMIAGATSSMVINSVINVLVPNIDIVLSIGGAIAGIFDYLLDKNLNNNIWEL